MPCLFLINEILWYWQYKTGKLNIGDKKNDDQDGDQWMGNLDIGDNIAIASKLFKLAT